MRREVYQTGRCLQLIDNDDNHVGLPLPFFRIRIQSVFVISKNYVSCVSNTGLEQR